MTSRCRRLGLQLADSMTEDVMTGKLDARSKGIALGIVIDKGQLLTGSATQITETHKGPSVSDVNEALDRLDAIDVEEVTDSESPQKLSN